MTLLECGRRQTNKSILNLDNNKNTQVQQDIQFDSICGVDTHCTIEVGGSFMILVSPSELPHTGNIFKGKIF